jgi:tyrosyl-tRNA synthetase
MTMADGLKLAAHFTVLQMSERDMFEKRLAENKPIHLHEFMYPLLQGYDSVAMNVDVELGGSDQIFNMLAGRTLLKEMKGQEKCVVALKLLTNDEGKKMSKSEGGFIALTDSPSEMFGKIMAMDDSMILPYFELATDVPFEEIAGMKIALEQGLNPRDLKVRLGTALVTMFHSAKEAEKAAKGFDAQFRDHQIPTEVTTLRVVKETGIIDVLVESGLLPSRGEARRQIEQGGVKVDGVAVTDINLQVQGTKAGVLIQKGKRHFVKLVL